jgi:adenylate cyclase
MSGNEKSTAIYRKKISHRGTLIFIGIAATIISIITTNFWFFNNLELKSIDWRFATRGTKHTSLPVEIVAIDDDSLNVMADKWTWPRTYYAKITDILKADGAKVIGFDIDFSSPSKTNPGQDTAFAKAVKKAGNVIVPVIFNVDRENNYVLNHALPPFLELSKAAAGVGFVGHAYDVDSNVRKSYLIMDDDSKRYLGLSMAMLGWYLGYPKQELEAQNGMIKWEKLEIPLAGENKFLINFDGPPKTFPTIPFYKVYNRDFKPGTFSGKIVIVGATSDILHDVFPTPFTAEGNMMPGVEIYANVMDTIYSGDFIRKPGKIGDFLYLIIIGIITSFLIFNFKAWQGFIIVFAEIIAYMAAASFIFSEYNYLVSLADPVFIMIFCYLSISTYKITVEEKEKHKIKATFSRYVSQNLVEELLNREIKLGGEKKEISVLFSDIRGFTSMSEKMEPENVVATLNEYLSEMTDVIFKNNGTLDKFIGDAVMALFGTPAFYPDHALRAVRTAFMMKDRLEKLNEKWKGQGRPTLKIGIGINTGEAIAGNMGSLQRMEYTVIGDTVNLASRLESLNKELGTEIIISSSTYEKVRDYVKVRQFTGIHVKGKEETLVVYEVTEVL